MPPNVPGSCCLLNTVHQSSASAATEISTLGNDRGEAGTASLTALQTLMSPGFALCSAPCWLHSHLHAAGSSRRESHKQEHCCRAGGGQEGLAANSLLLEQLLEQC